MKEIPEIRTNCRYLFAEEEQHTGTAQGVGLGEIQPSPPQTFWLIKSLFFFTLAKQVCLLQKVYVTLFYVKYTDLLANSAFF